MWEDELFDEIQKGDKVWYCGAPTMHTVHGPAKAMMIGPAGWVCDKGDGQPIVVNEGFELPGTHRRQGQRTRSLRAFLKWIDY